MNISVIIPNYNGKGLLEKNLSTVIVALFHYLTNHKQTGEIIIVDDGSRDDSVSFLEEFVEKEKSIAMHIEKNRKNKGFSSTVNKGVSLAKGDIVVLLNTDVRPEKNFLEPLLTHFKEENVFAVGCMDKSIEHNKVVLRGRGVGGWRRGMFFHAAGDVTKHTSLWASGGSSAFRTSLWVKLGGLNELYNPFYWEDIDLSYRAIKSGYQVLFEQESVVIHEHEKGTIRSLYASSQVQRIAYRNQFIFIWKNITEVSFWISHIIYLPYHILRSVLRGDMNFLIGLFQAFVFLPNIIQSIFTEHRFFVRNDSAIVKEYSQ